MTARNVRRGDGDEDLPVTTPAAVVAGVAARFGVPVEALCGRDGEASNGEWVRRARAAAVHRLRDLGMAWKDVARYLGFRGDHSTVIHLAKSWPRRRGS